MAMDLTSLPPLIGRTLTLCRRHHRPTNTTGTLQEYCEGTACPHA